MSDTAHERVDLMNTTIFGHWPQNGAKPEPLEWIILETSEGYSKKDLHPGDKPCATFILNENETVVAAYEYCNLHGLWSTK